jgi:hypothetical protein
VQTAAVAGLKLLESKLTERLEQRRLVAGAETQGTTGANNGGL